MMKIEKFIGVIFLLFILQYSRAQETRVIEPSIMEVNYQVKYEKMLDYYALRIGKNVCQYFSYEKYRSDSLGSNPETAMLLLNELLEAVNKKNDKTKQEKGSPGHGDYIYRWINKDSCVTYTGVFASKYRIAETTLKQEWTIYEDSTKNVLGFNCHMAKTHFRGREWTVWYSEDIPILLGPWKLGGLPGLILEVQNTGFIEIKAVSIDTKNLKPVTFYNFWNKKFEDIDRKTYLREAVNPKNYPKRMRMTPRMECE
jgi:GLPGLI family protein